MLDVRLMLQMKIRLFCAVIFLNPYMLYASRIPIHYSAIRFMGSISTDFLVSATHSTMLSTFQTHAAGTSKNA
jgi:hypothetical protein